MALLVHRPVSVFDLRYGRRPAILALPARSLDAEVLFIHFALVRSLTGADDPRLGLETVDLRTSASSRYALNEFPVTSQLGTVFRA